MTTRIQNAFLETAKISYLTAGDGGIDKSIDYFLALVVAGSNVIEIGVPYSDPIADGVVIQDAMIRALKLGINIYHILHIIIKVREKTDVAIIVFSYYNPIQAELFEFLVGIKNAGADGILIVDLPFEESQSARYICTELQLEFINIITVTSMNRINMILENTNNGFVYYACQNGTTGKRNEIPTNLSSNINEIRKFTSLPIAVGFGISNHNMIRSILKVADGYVVGSYFVNAVANKASPNDLTNLAFNLFNP